MLELAMGAEAGSANDTVNAYSVFRSQTWVPSATLLIKHSRPPLPGLVGSECVNALKCPSI
jgi:hypothetical protein